VRVARLGASNQLARQLDKGCKQRDCDCRMLMVGRRFNVRGAGEILRRGL
jgi:hypothetical protein